MNDATPNPPPRDSDRMESAVDGRSPAPLPTYFDLEEEALRAAAILVRVLGDGERRVWRDVCAVVEAERDLAPRDACDVAYGAYRALSVRPAFTFHWTGRPGEKRIRMVRTAPKKGEALHALGSSLTEPAQN